MVRFIVVIDLELQKSEWINRTTAMKILLKQIASKQILKDTFTMRRTHMKGFRAVFRDSNDLKDLIQNDKETSIPTWEFETHSETDYASIFFINWPIELIQLLPVNLT